MATKFGPRFGLELQREFLINKLEQLKTGIRPEDERRADGNNESGEQANETLELEKRRALEKHLRGQLKEIEHALQKFELGTYGLCDVCGQPVEPTRLEALPQANLCLSCKTRQARSAR